MCTPAVNAPAFWLRTSEEIAEFRGRALTVENLLKALRDAGGALLVTLDTGVGKTHLIDATAKPFAAGTPPAPYDLLIYFTSRRDIIAERPWTRGAGRKWSRVAVLLGRPRDLCGPLDPDWQPYERAGCTQAGRRDICGACPRRDQCPWPGQYTRENLEGRTVVAALAAHIGVVPSFVRMVTERVGARRPLVIIDEATLLDAPIRHELSRDALAHSQSAFATVLAAAPDEARHLQPWLDLHGKLLDSTVDLRAIELPSHLPAYLAEAVQTAGMARFRSFKFLGYEIPQLLMSRRWRNSETGAIEYLRRPLLRGVDYVLAAAGVSLQLARQRLDEPAMQEFSPGVRVLHEGTRVYNLRTSLATAAHFERNAPQVLWVCAQLAARELRDGKRVLFVAKKRLAARALKQITVYLADLLGPGFRAVQNAGPKTLADRKVVPVITFGTQGLNAYEGFDAAIALGTFNARTDVLEERLNELHGPGEDVRIEVIHQTGRRFARAVGAVAEQQGFSELAQDYLHHLEGAWAEQALGRVRFAVAPRLVLFMQQSAVRFPLDAEFRSLAELRTYFGLKTRQEWEHDQLEARISELRAVGKTQVEVAKALGVSERTVRRHQPDKAPERNTHKGVWPVAPDADSAENKGKSR